MGGKRITYERLSLILSEYKLKIIPNITKFETVKKYFICEDTNGYYVYVSLDSIRNNNKPTIFDKRNPYTLKNIQRWIILNGKEYSLNGSQTYSDANSTINLICAKCGSEFESSWANMSLNRNCPYCCVPPQKVNHTNCISTTHPHLVKYFLDKNVADTLSFGSSIDVDMICDNCGDVRKYSPNYLTNRGFVCLKCSDGISIPEKFIYSLFKQIGLNFQTQKRFDGIEDKYYDFYFELNGHPYCCEAHGRQHYKHSGRGRSLKEEQDNDELKYSLAIQNGVKPENYIVVDCRKSELEYLKENCIKSLDSHFDLSNIDWLNIWDVCNRSLVYEVCDYFNKNNKSVFISDICDEFKLHYSTILNYLKIGTQLGICNYSIKEQRYYSSSRCGKASSKPIVKMSLDMIFIEQFKSITECCKKYNYDLSRIAKCCKNINRIGYGFKWMYKTDYEKLIQSKQE